MTRSDRTIVMGFYQGIGDFLSAVPTANELLRRGNRVVMVVSRANRQLADLIAFKTERLHLVEFAPFSESPIKSLRVFERLRRTRPDMIVVSPHARREVSSWKLPLLLWAVKRLSRKLPPVIGSDDDRLSHLYDRRLPVDKKLGLIAREWLLHRMAGSIDENATPDLAVFKQPYEFAASAPCFDLVVHPGASRNVKIWPLDYHRELLERLGGGLRLAYIGTNGDLQPLRAALGGHENIEFIAGTLKEAVSVMANASVALTMDSGFSHVAALLGVRHLAIFGSTDPGVYRPPSERSTVLYRQALPCQPCHEHRCRLDHIACMRLIEPQEVAAAVGQALAEGATVATKRRPHTDWLTSRKRLSVFRPGGFS
jgi:ADP-heptose:LPS heptosyltransferase